MSKRTIPTGHDFNSLPLDERCELVYEAIERGKEVPPSALWERFDTTSIYVYQALRALVELRRLERIGWGPTTAYRVPDDTIRRTRAELEADLNQWVYAADWLLDRLAKATGRDVEELRLEMERAVEARFVLAGQ